MPGRAGHDAAQSGINHDHDSTRKSQSTQSFDICTVEHISVPCEAIWARKAHRWAREKSRTG